MEFDRIALEWEATPTLVLFEAAYRVAGVTLTVRSDDQGALDDLAILLGPPDRRPSHSSQSVPLRALIRAHG